MFHIHTGSHLYVLKPLKVNSLLYSFFYSVIFHPLSAKLDSVEEVIGLLVHLLVSHLFHPGSTHIRLAGGVLVSELIVLSLLDHQRVSQVCQVLRILVILAITRVVGLVVQLVYERVVVPSGLAGILHSHLVDDLLVFLGAVMRLLVHLSFRAVVVALLTVPLALLVNESLVHLQVRLILFVGLLGLRTPQVQITVEGVFFALALLLQLHQVLLVALQSGERSLICYGHRLVVLGVAVAQRVVVVAEGAVRAQERWHVCVVGLRNLLAVQSLLDDLLQVALGLGLVGVGGRSDLGRLNGGLGLVLAEGLGVEAVRDGAIEFAEHVRVGLSVAQENQLGLLGVLELCVGVNWLLAGGLARNFNFTEANVLVLK